MANRCPDCNKFVPLEPADPEASLDVRVERDGSGQVTSVVVTADVRVALVCVECGTEMREHDFSIEEEVPLESMVDTLAALGNTLSDHPATDPDAEHDPDVQAHDEWTAEEGGVEALSDERKRKKQYGFHLDYSVQCECGVPLYEGVIESMADASEFEEC